MGFLARIGTTITPARRAQTPGPLDDFWYTPEGWIGSLTTAGVRVSPDLAMTLSAVWCATTLIADDIATMPCQAFQLREDGGKTRLRQPTRGLGISPYKLRWQPNLWQTAKEFWSMMIGHYLLRGNAYAEIVAGPSGFADQLIPRHPDRVKPERLPSGRLRFKVEQKGTERPRYLTQDEVFHFHDLSGDGLTGMSRIAYGLQSFGASLAADAYAQNFFRQGATVGLVATSKGGELDETDRKDLHTSLSLYAAGTKNAGGILVIEDDISIEKIGVEPEKAQLLASREFTVRDVARWFKMPAHKLQATGQTETYNSIEVKELGYLIGTLRPIVITLEQAIQRDLVLGKDEYFTEFLMDALLRGDTAARATYYRTAIQFGWMNRNEVRLLENLNPEPGLERFLEPTNMTDPENAQANRRTLAMAQRPSVRAALLAFEAGQRIVRKERAAVLKLAERHASDVEAWKAGLRTFYEDHAGFVAQTLHVPLAAARAYAADHGTVLEQRGVAVFTEDWDQTVAAELAAWALEGAAHAA